MWIALFSTCDACLRSSILACCCILATCSSQCWKSAPPLTPRVLSYSLLLVLK